MKNIIILFSIILSLFTFFVGCASNKELDKSNSVSKILTTDSTKQNVLPTDEEYLNQLNSLFKFFKTYRYKEDQEKIDTFFVNITDESTEWIQEMNEAVQYEDSVDVVKRPFFEILTIAGVRLLYRNNEIEQLDSAEVLKIMTSRYGILKRAFGVSNLGPMWMQQKDGNRYGYRGMASSPKVPVYYFVWSYEYFRWQLDLNLMLPIISRGLETVGLKKKWTASETALSILEAAMDYEVNGSLLHPR